MQRREALELFGTAFCVPSLFGASPAAFRKIAKTVHDQLGAPLPRARLVLDEHQDRTVLTIAELIIPATDTPGAKDARVNEFIDVLLAEWFEDDERTRFLRGLANVDVRSLDLFGQVFVEATPSEQTALLHGLDAEVTAMREAGLDAGTHFFATMKWLTMYGYYTSEVGQTEELQSEIRPGRYDPCAPVTRDTPGGW